MQVILPRAVPVAPTALCRRREEAKEARAEEAGAGMSGPGAEAVGSRSGQQLQG